MVDGLIYDNDTVLQTHHVCRTWSAQKREIKADKGARGGGVIITLYGLELCPSLVFSPLWDLGLTI